VDGRGLSDAGERDDTTAVRVRRLPNDIFTAEAWRITWRMAGAVKAHAAKVERARDMVFG
jgi:hypothetical protein